jgi:hypothetical protein
LLRTLFRLGRSSPRLLRCHAEQSSKIFQDIMEPVLLSTDWFGFSENGSGSMLCCKLCDGVYNIECEIWNEIDTWACISLQILKMPDLVRTAPVVGLVLLVLNHSKIHLQNVRDGEQLR